MGGWTQSASCGIPGMEVELEFGSEQGIECRGDRVLCGGDRGLRERGEIVCVCVCCVCQDPRLSEAAISCVSIFQRAGNDL